MRHFIAIFSLFALSACADGAPSPQVVHTLGTTHGRLFCEVQAVGGGSVIVGLVNAAVIGLLPVAAPAVILATGASKSYVDTACALADGVPVSPPPDPAAAPIVPVEMPHQTALNGVRS